MSRKSTRRDFLTGKAAADAAADALGGAIPAGPIGGAYLVRVSRRAMACEFEVQFNAGQYEDDTRLALEALDLVDRMEDQLSFFREHSELSHVNRTAAEGPVEVDAELFELLETALRISQETEGAFDLTASPLWEAWGFAQRAGRTPDDETLSEALSRVGSQFVELDPERQTIRFLKPGLRLNLGAIGKGYALDRCAEQLASAGVGDFLIHGGGSSVLARGSQSTGQESKGQRNRDGWLLGVRHPTRPDRRLAEIRLRDRGLATSGSWAQSFVHGGRRLGHILDPRTGWPAEGVLSTTVVAPSATLADALSTAFYVMGPEKSLDFCRDRPELGVLLACPGKGPGGVEAHSAGFGEGELTLLG
jgi:FAD:protein FMN transferase